MKKISELEKKRMDSMIFETNLAICPNCGDTVYPKFVYYKGEYEGSHLRWCNNCYKAKAVIFWKYI